MTISITECLTTSKSSLIDFSNADIVKAQKLEFWKYCSEKIEGFKIIPDNRDALNGLFGYFHGEFGTLDQNKGIYLFGEFGCGKTTIMMLFSKYLAHYFPFSQFGFANFSTEEVIETYMFEKEGKEMKRYLYSPYSDKPRAICFHEIGKELNEKHYGTDIDQVINRLMMRRYELFQGFGKKTHVTSNFRPEKLKCFDSAVLDRFKEMYNFVEWKGKSLR